MTNRPSLLVFDVGNVIVLADDKRAFATLQKLGVAANVCRRVYGEQYRAFGRGEVDEAAFCDTLRKELECTLSNANFKEAHHDALYALDAGVVAVLDHLQQLGRRLVFATDTNPWQTARERELIDLSRYGKAFRSHELGMYKIDPGFFPLMLNVLRVPAHEVLLIDDSPEKLAAAERCGVRILGFTSALQLKADLKAMGMLV